MSFQDKKAMYDEAALPTMTMQDAAAMDCMGREEAAAGESFWLNCYEGPQTGGAGKRGSSLKDNTLEQCTDEELKKEFLGTAPFVHFDKQRTDLGNKFKASKLTSEDRIRVKEV